MLKNSSIHHNLNESEKLSDEKTLKKIIMDMYTIRSI